MSKYSNKDREYVRYCLRYAVTVLGKAEVNKYVWSLDADGSERAQLTWLVHTERSNLRAQRGCLAFYVWRFVPDSRHWTAEVYRSDVRVDIADFTTKEDAISFCEAWR